MDEHFKAVLVQSHNRLTTPRRELFMILKAASSPLSIAEMVKRAPQIERTSVYRTVQLFQQLGIIKVVPYGWKQRYELTEPFLPHHHHMHCERCGATIEVDSDRIEQLVQRLAQEEGFHVTGHHFEINGVCETCSTKKAHL